VFIARLSLLLPEVAELAADQPGAQRGNSLGVSGVCNTDVSGCSEEVTWNRPCTTVSMRPFRVVVRRDGRVSLPVTAAVTVVCVLAVTALIDGAEPTPGDAEAAQREPHIGLASWYGSFHHGRPTASGERFDMHGMTAAHRTLPLGSVLLVENLRNGRVVKVRVNDRGPFKPRRELDLSYGAAHALGGVRDGLIPVRYHVVKGR
jgi:rare lipoprotein A